MSELVELSRWSRTSSAAIITLFVASLWLTTAHGFLFTGARAGTGGGPPLPRNARPDPWLAGLTQVLRRTQRRDVLIISGNAFTSLGAVRGADHTKDTESIVLPAFGGEMRSGPLITQTGVALREFANPKVVAAKASFIVPCSTTSLAPDQTAYVYLGGFTRTIGGRLQLTEIGVQMNPPAGGGVPTSVQLYARRETKTGVLVAGTNLHLHCDARVNVVFETLGIESEAATFSGPAIPLPSHRVTIVEKLDAGERTVNQGCSGCAVERVTALAVPRGSGAERRGARLGIPASGAEPQLAFEEDRDFITVQPSHEPPVLTRNQPLRTTIAIDERSAR